MKRLISVTMVVGCVLAVAPGLRAQDCSSINDWQLRGTYTFWGSGWTDLSKSFDKSLPAGYSPMAFLQAFTFDGKGNGAGWISGNAGGFQFDFPMKFTYAVQPDCSIRGTTSFNIGGVWTPPTAVMWVISDTRGTLELSGYIRGTGPGSQVPHGTARRIMIQQ